MNETFEIRFKTPQVLFLIVILGFLVRIFNLQEVGLWMDEIHSAIGTDPSKSWNEVVEYSKTDQPPLYFLLMHLWFKCVPFNDFTGRMVSVMIGIISIGAIYLLGTEVKNNRVGLIAAFLVAINYFHVDHSRQFRFYPLVFLFATLSFLFFLRIFRNKGPADFVFYVLATSALLNTHYFGLVVLLSQFLLFLILVAVNKETDIKFIAGCLFSGLLAGLSLAHWLPVILSDLKISIFHLAPVKWTFLADYFYFYFRDFITTIVLGFLFLLALRDFLILIKSRQNLIVPITLIGWIILGFAIPLIYSWVKLPILEFKYTFILFPAIIVMIALGFESTVFQRWNILSSFRLRRYLLVGLFLVFAGNTLFYKSLYYVAYPPEEWREVSSKIVETDADTQLVFSTYAWYYRYYFKIYNAVNPPLEHQYADFHALIKNAATVWVIESTRFPETPLAQEYQQKLNGEFQLFRELRFTDAIARCYKRPQASAIR